MKTDKRKKDSGHERVAAQRARRWFDADSAEYPTYEDVRAMVAFEEKQRRGVKFLPEQVLRRRGYCGYSVDEAWDVVCTYRRGKEIEALVRERGSVSKAELAALGLLAFDVDGSSHMRSE